MKSKQVLFSNLKKVPQSDHNLQTTLIPNREENSVSIIAPMQSFKSWDLCIFQLLGIILEIVTISTIITEYTYFNIFGV